MLEGLDAGPIIAGAYTSDDGICPMLAAHRAGGRCSAAFFADAWDRFAFRDGRGRRTALARRVNERELRILRAHLEASLLDEELAEAYAPLRADGDVRDRADPERPPMPRSTAATGRAPALSCAAGRLGVEPAVPSLRRVRGRARPPARRRPMRRAPSGRRADRAETVAV